MKKVLLFMLMVCYAMVSNAQGTSCSSAIIATQGATNQYTFENNQREWFQYTLTQDSKVLLKDESSDPDSFFEVFDSCSGYRFAYASNEGFFNGEAGVTYYIRCKSRNSLPFTWSITETSLISGESCIAPTPAKMGQSNVHTKGYREYQWFSYTATRTCKIEISNVLFELSTQYEIYTDCGSSSIVSGVKNISFVANEGQTYYIYMRNLSEKNVFWSLQEVDLELGEDCSTAIDLNAGSDAFYDGSSNDVVWFKYQATKDGIIEVQNHTDDEAPKYIIYTTCGGDEIGAGENNGYFTVEKDQIYYILWYNSTGNDFNWTLNYKEEVKQGQTYTHPLAAVVGDNEVDHVSLGGDAWFSFSPLTKGKVTVSTCDLTTENTYVYVYKGGEDILQIAENNNECSSQSKVVFDVEAEQTYYIMWSNLYHLTNSYYWNLSFETDDSSTDVDIHKSNDFLIYPNPAKNEFYIQSDEEIEAVKVINASGMLVRNYSHSNSSYPIDFVQGIYLVQIVFSDGTFKQQKLMVK